MRVCIHRGTKQIGGTCVEIEASGSRIIVDLGLPLDAVEANLALVPQISGLREHDPSLLAIVLSHGHRDHWGLVPKVRPDIPIVMGRATERIMRAAADFVPDAFVPNAWKHLESGKPLQIGPFAIAPHLVDHSGFDAYALEIEAGERRLFYSGDLRGYGRKSKLFELMMRRPPKNIDVMVMEGSSFGRLPDDVMFETEDDLENIFADRFEKTAGMALVACSAQNIDRVVTIYRAAKRTDRTLIVDAYAAEVLKSTGYDSIPKPVLGWANIAVLIPQSQRVSLKHKGIAPIVDGYQDFRVWPEQLAEIASRSVMLFRGWMLKDLERAGALEGARVIWSQWDGYLKEGSGAQLKAHCEARGIPFEIIHTSGHAGSELVVCEGKFFNGFNPTDLNEQLRSQRRQVQHLFRNRVDDAHKGRLRAYRHVAILPSEPFDTPAVDADVVVAWKDIRDLAEKLMGAHHYVTERLREAVRRYEEDDGDPGIPNWDGKNVPFDAMREKCKKTEGIQVGYVGGEAALLKLSLVEAEDRKWKWRYSDNRGRVIPGNWLEGTRWLEIVESSHGFGSGGGGGPG